MLNTIAKKLVSGILVCALFLSMSFLPALTAPSAAASVQKANTIILELSSSSKDDLKDLSYGEGKLFKKIARAIERLKDSGEVDPEAQPVIFVVKKKKSKDW